jgi:hypothetical protein
LRQRVVTDDSGKQFNTASALGTDKRQPLALRRLRRCLVRSRVVRQKLHHANAKSVGYSLERHKPHVAFPDVGVQCYPAAKSEPGGKVIEIRKFTDKYFNMFFDRDRLREALAVKDCEIDEAMIRDDIEYVHFYPYSNSWALDCRIDEIGVFSVCSGDAGLAHLAEAYDFHEFDDMVADYNTDNAPIFFYLHIAEIVALRGL